MSAHELDLPVAVKSGLEELKQALTSLYGGRFQGLVLYGSYARGTADENSDVDVLVLLEGPVRPGAEITRISVVTSEICLRYGVLISTFPISAEWFETYRTPFLQNIRREGVLVLKPSVLTLSNL